MVLLSKQQGQDLILGVLKLDFRSVFALTPYFVSLFTHGEPSHVRIYFSGDYDDKFEP